MLNLFKDGNCTMSSAMIKCTGLYYIIDPKSAKIRGHNVFHITVMVMITFTAICLLMCPFGLYYWANDVTQFVLQFIALINFLFGCFKAFTIVRHSDDIRRCLDITRFDFVSSARADPDSTRFFQTCRNVSMKFTGWFAVCSHFVLLMWTLLPFVVGSSVEIKNRDNSISIYHFNPYNMYFMVSSEMYNEWHLIFHLLEWMVGLCFVLFMILFDTFMVILCNAITYQMRYIAAAYSKLGHNCRTISKPYFDDYQKNLSECFTSGAIESDTTKNECLNNLKLIIKHHQEVLGKMNDFYKIVRPVILPQLIIASFTISFGSFVITQIYFNGTLLTSTQSLKMCSFPIFFYQIYYTCLVFGDVDKQKSEMNFALYSSNWTKMEIQFKKLLLLAMRMHDAHKSNMKLTAELIINLEIFTRVINLCYSIFSVLVKSQLKVTNK